MECDPSYQRLRGQKDPWEGDPSYQHIPAVQLDLPLSIQQVHPTAVCMGDVTLLETLRTSGQRYACLYADPPWPYTNTATRAAATRHYSTMTIQDLTRLPVVYLAQPNAHLYLWVTNAFLQEGLTLLRAWGFRYVTKATWCKTQIGLGNYMRNATEDLLLGIRGTLPFRDKSQSTWFITGRGTHSRKPDIARQRIERASPGPYLELFGREAVPGWTVWGNQIEGSLFNNTRETA